MATQAQVVDSVRRRVSDFTSPRKYADPFYFDAVSFALSKLSHDFAEDYLDASDVPASRSFLLVKLATIEMCYIRAAEQAEAGELGGDIDSITVPDLIVSGEGSSGADRAESWITLASKLQSEYDDELALIGSSESVGDIGVGQLNRKSLTHGGLAIRKIDRGLDAVSLSAAVDGSDVSLTWNVLYTDLFYSYEVYRATSAVMAGEEIVTTIYDNHEVEYIDEGLSVGTYYYRVKSVNPNQIKTNSSIVSVEVV